MSIITLREYIIHPTLMKNRFKHSKERGSDKWNPAGLFKCNSNDLYFIDY